MLLIARRSRPWQYTSTVGKDHSSPITTGAMCSKNTRFVMV